MAAALHRLWKRVGGTVPAPQTPLAQAGVPPLLRDLPGVEWAWAADLAARPQSGALDNGVELLPGLKLFHDGAAASLSLGAAAAGGLALQLKGFAGSFLSLVIDLPSEAVQGLRARHLIRLDTGVGGSAGPAAYARLNIRHGPNVEQAVRQLPCGQGSAQMAEFDMFYVGLNEKRVEAAWIDLIFNPGSDDSICLSHLIASRRPRAAL